MKIYNEPNKVNTFGQLKKIKIKCDGNEKSFILKEVEKALKNNKSFNSLCENNDVYVIGKVNKENIGQFSKSKGDCRSFDLKVKIAQGIFKKLYSSIHFNPDVYDHTYTCHNYIYGDVRTMGYYEYTPGIDTFYKFINKNQGFFDEAKTQLDIKGETIRI